ncbi:MAG: imelysin family protein [Pseudomonadota bacterium]
MLTWLGVSGAAQAQEFANDQFHAFNMAVVDKRILPAYRTLADAAIELQQSSEALCADRSQAKLSTVKSRFHQFTDAWMAIQYFRIGPVEFAFRSSHIQYWPDKHNVVSKQLAKLLSKQDPTVLEPENFRDVSAGLQGLSALERVIFSSDSEEKLLASADDAPYRCALLVAIAHNLAWMTNAIVRDWESGKNAFRTQVLAANDESGSDFFADPTELAYQILSRLRESVQAVHDLKIGRPLGKAGSRPKPRRAEMWRSERSLENVRQNLEVVADYFADTGPLSIFSESESAHERIDSADWHLGAALKALAGIESISATSLESAPTIEALKLAQSQLDDAIESIAKLLVALGGSAGFNSLDGD